MKIIAKIMMFIGVVAFFLGASGIDNPSIVAPIVLIVSGMGVIYTGNRIDEEFV